jgi:hypothetical protein
MSFQPVVRKVKVKKLKDYEEGPDPGEWLVFEEEPEEKDVEETLQRDLEMIHRIFACRHI